MAFALGLDPAFVGAHHVVRLLALSIFVPLWLHLSGAVLPAKLKDKMSGMWDSTGNTAGENTAGGTAAGEPVIRTVAMPADTNPAVIFSAAG